jgi:hypothetical protein
VTTYGRTPTSALIDDVMVDAVAVEAEAGYAGWDDLKPGRPPAGQGPAGPLPARSVRMPQALERMLIERATAEGSTPSQVIREALAFYFAAS